TVLYLHSSCSSLSIARPPPISTLFPYTTLFRSRRYRFRGEPVVRHVVDPRGRQGHQGRDAEQVRLPDAWPHELPLSALRQHQGRSEEHTSELQSRENLVCRLLLEKKKKQKDISM